jgi:hypothetical protein
MERVELSPSLPRAHPLSRRFDGVPQEPLGMFDDQKADKWTSLKEQLDALVHEADMLGERFRTVPRGSNSSPVWRIDSGGRRAQSIVMHKAK